MSRTRHLIQRCSQRGIRQSLLETVRQFGSFQHGDRCVLSRRGAEEAIRELNRIRKDLMDAASKGGVVLVTEDGLDVTAWRLESFSRAKARASRCEQM